MEPIRFYNRYTQGIEEEQVYGEGFLRWAYENPLGKLTTELIVKRAIFSRWYGWRMDRAGSREKVVPFIEKFGIKTEEHLDSIDSYRTFNDFFYRKLKPEARPIASDADEVCFPADGRHIGFQDVSECDGVFVKGQKFDVAGLLESDALGDRFKNGSLVLSRLCPVDYHRYHFPCEGRVKSQEMLPRKGSGVLYSVNPVALAQDLSIFWKNKRLLTLLDTADLGQVAILEIGATCVGSIVSTSKTGEWVAKGQEKGYFRFGGSSVITIFEPGKVQLSEDLLHHSANMVETYVRMGDVMGKRN